MCDVVNVDGKIRTDVSVKLCKINVPLKMMGFNKVKKS